MRPGSIIVEFQLAFTKKIADPLVPLKEEIKDGTMGSLKVDPISLKIKEEYSYRDKTPEKENNLLLILVSVLIGLVGVVFLVAVAVIVYRKLHRPVINPNQLSHLSNVELKEMDACPNAYDNVEPKERDACPQTYDNVDEVKVMDASPHTYETVKELKVMDTSPHAYDNVHFQTFEQEGKNKDFS